MKEALLDSHGSHPQEASDDFKLVLQMFVEEEETIELSVNVKEVSKDVSLLFA